MIIIGIMPRIVLLLPNFTLQIVFISAKRVYELIKWVHVYYVKAIERLRTRALINSDSNTDWGIHWQCNLSQLNASRPQFHLLSSIWIHSTYLASVSATFLNIPYILYIKLLAIFVTDSYTPVFLFMGFPQLGMLWERDNVCSVVNTMFDTE